MTPTFSPATGPFQSGYLDVMHEAMNEAARPAALPAAPCAGPVPSPVYAPPDLLDPLARIKSDKRFLSSDVLPVARKEWETAHQALLDFCNRQGLRHAADELAQLTLNPRQLATKKISEADCLREDFKGPLEALAQHVGDERIALTARCQILEGIDGLNYCLQRQRAELRKAAMELGAHLGGARAAASLVYVKLSEAHLREMLLDEPWLKDQDFTTPHALQSFARALNLPHFLPADALKDSYALDINLYADVIDRCGPELLRRIDGMAMADWLAGECLEEARAMLAHELGGMTPDFHNGDGHWSALQQVVLRLAHRYGRLNPASFCSLPVPKVLTADEKALAGDAGTKGEGDGPLKNAAQEDDPLVLCPERLADSPAMLAIDFRRKLTEERLLRDPTDIVLDQYTKFGAPHRVGLFEGRPYVRIDCGGGTPPLLRPLEISETQQLLGSVPRLRPLDEERLRDHLVTSCSAGKTACIARNVSLKHPTPERIGHVIEHVVLDDDTLAGWMGTAPEQWDAPTLDNAFHQILRCSQGGGAWRAARALDGCRIPGVLDAPGAAPGRGHTRRQHGSAHPGHP
jgi:hypothetical protein